MTSIPTNHPPAETCATVDDATAVRARAYQARIEGVLEAVLPAAAEVPQRLHAAQRYAVLGGGSRLHPLLVYFTGEVLGIPADLLDAPAAAVELMHAYSLVHHDLPAMDNNDLRCGRPTTHRAYDEATAILAGDALQVRAFSLLAAEPSGLGADARLEAIRILADAGGTAGMTVGQALERGAVGALIRAGVLMAAACRPDLPVEVGEALDGYARDMSRACWPARTGVAGPASATATAQALIERACARLQVLGPPARPLSWLASRIVDRRDWAELR